MKKLLIITLCLFSCLHLSVAALDKSLLGTWEIDNGSYQSGQATIEFQANGTAILSEQKSSSKDLTFYEWSTSGGQLTLAITRQKFPRINLDEKKRYPADTLSYKVTNTSLVMTGIVYASGKTWTKVK